MADLVLGGLTVSEDDRGRLHFWGEVFNLGEVTQRWGRVTIQLLGANSEPLAELADLVGLEWTLPGGRNPFHIRFLDPPKGWHTYVIQLTGQEHDYHDLTLPQPYAGLDVSHDHYREINRSDLRCSIIGLLSNRGLAHASHVKVCGTLYNPEGKVVGVLSPYLVPRGSFAPGSSMVFELKYYVLGGEVSNYSLQVQGRILPGA